jgi:ribosome-binding protein aMBF1 (putative translation factor)
VVDEWISPIGKSVTDDLADRLEDPEFRVEYERLRPFEELARIVIFRRAALELTQAELAARMGTTASVISRIESGQHRTSARTLKRLAEALDARAVIGFEFGSVDAPERELVAL